MDEKNGFSLLKNLIKPLILSKERSFWRMVAVSAMVLLIILILPLLNTTQEQSSNTNHPIAREHEQRERQKESDPITNDDESRKISAPDIEMVFVQGGTFIMGYAGEMVGEIWDRAKPAHEVTVSSFYIGKYEITQAQWQAVMGNNPSHFKGVNLPVEQVTWDDAQKFIRRLNAATGKQYRLPTEAQWEYAARGGNKSQGFRRSGSNNVDDVAWYEKNSEKRTHFVGSKQPNELDVFDMNGNVREWCLDWYDNSGYHSSSPQQDPVGASSGSRRVVRGGSWFMAEDVTRVDDRFGVENGHRSHTTGFRVVHH